MDQISLNPTTEIKASIYGKDISENEILRYEVEASRRALAMLKNELGQEKLHELIKPQLDE